jgi:hypothetical protein
VVSTQRVAEISKLNLEWVAQGRSLEERARHAWQIRHEARTEARSMMESAVEIEDLRARDLRLYGNPDGPTFEQLVQDNPELRFILHLIHGLDGPFAASGR